MFVLCVSIPVLNLMQISKARVKSRVKFDVAWNRALVRLQDSRIFAFGRNARSRQAKGLERAVLDILYTLQIFFFFHNFSGSY